VAGSTFLMQGSAYLSDWHKLTWITLVAVVLALSGGICLLVGILTPATSVIVVLGTIGYALSWIPAPPANLLDSNAAIIDDIAITTAIAFLGPGAFSLDARLFGRREIFIPQEQPPRNHNFTNTELP